MKICVTGDLMQHSRNHLSESQRNFSYDNIFSEEILEIFKSSDLVIGQLETNIIENKQPEGFPTFNTHRNFLKALKNAGIDVLCLANNHSFDHGHVNFNMTTMNVIKEGIIPVGNRMFNQLIDVPGFKKQVNIINFTNISNVNIKGKVNHSLSDYKNYKEDFKISNNFINIGIFHDGEEYSSKLTDSQTHTFNELNTLARKYRSKFDILISNHSHVIGEVNSLDFTSTCYYSNGLGNTLSWQESLDKQIGLIAVIEINEQTNYEVKKYKTETIFKEDGFQQCILLKEV